MYVQVLVDLCFGFPDGYALRLGEEGAYDPVEGGKTRDDVLVRVGGESVVERELEQPPVHRIAYECKKVAVVVDGKRVGGASLHVDPHGGLHVGKNAFQRDKTP